eukprot:GHVU01093572.1.p1 GENE.GHVU01093572.1~~GHVU01093572.1.p1  ORF type:complete len:227 (+),score=18.66 GHVU01093572.1:199-879(+)
MALALIATLFALAYPRERSNAYTFLGVAPGASAATLRNAKLAMTARMSNDDAVMEELKKVWEVVSSDVRSPYYSKLGDYVPLEAIAKATTTKDLYPLVLMSLVTQALLFFFGWMVTIPCRFNGARQVPMSALYICATPRNQFQPLFGLPNYCRLISESTRFCPAAHVGLLRPRPLAQTFSASANQRILRPPVRREAATEAAHTEQQLPLAHMWCDDFTDSICAEKC